MKLYTRGFFGYKNEARLLLSNEDLYEIANIFGLLSFFTDDVEFEFYFNDIDIVVTSAELRIVHDSYENTTKVKLIMDFKYSEIEKEKFKALKEFISKRYGVNKIEIKDLGDKVVLEKIEIEEVIEQ